MDEKVGEAKNPTDGPIVEERQTEGRTWKVKTYTAEHRKPPVSHVPRSNALPGFDRKGSSRDCPRCGFSAFGWAKECSRCGEPLN